MQKYHRKVPCDTCCIFQVFCGYTIGFGEKTNWNLTYYLTNILTLVSVYNCEKLGLMNMWHEIQSMCFLLSGKYICCAHCYSVHLSTHSEWRKYTDTFLEISRHFLMLYFYWFRFVHKLCAFPGWAGRAQRPTSVCAIFFFKSPFLVRKSKKGIRH